MRNFKTSLAGIVAILPAVISCGAESAAPVDDESSSAPFSTTPGEPNHEEITAAALDFLRPEVLLSIIAGNVSTDVEFFLVNANHFDDCNFSGGAAVVAAQQAAAVQNLDPADVTPEADGRAALAFSRSLHALQDFYAHTNWVELGGTVLVDASLGTFPSLAPYSTIPSSGFVVIQGSKDRKTALNRDEAAPYPDSAVVSFKTKQGRAPGLISGTVDYEEGDFCPASVAMTHDELNKDKSTLADRVPEYEAARSLAIAQTRHEWCRLTELARAAWGEAGAARLAAWVAAGATAPDCAAQ
jgi:hypothetical protein